MKQLSTKRLALISTSLAFALTASAQPAKDAPPATAEKPAAEKPAAEKPAAEKPAAEKPKAPPAAGSNILVEKTDGGGKLFRITEGLVVEGQRQKPNAFYVLQRASAPYDWEALEENFLPRILKAAEKPPF